MPWIRLLLITAALTLAGPASAVLQIQITQGTDGGRPIAIVPFVSDGGSPPEDVAAIVQADLQRSGTFTPLPTDRLPQRPASVQDIDFGLWRSAGQESLVIGSLSRAGNGQWVAAFQLFETIGGRQLLTLSVPAADGNLRKAAHKISDQIYETLTGVRGAFSTSVAYINVQGVVGRRVSTLEVADSDGYNPKVILTSDQPLLSPSWSPDGSRLAYVSFENRRPEIFVQTLANGSRIKVSGRAGLNSAPAWSPRGDSVVITLSSNGDPDLYLLRIADQSVTRLTDTGGIDTEPVWSLDGSAIYFTSDRSGQPQIYRIPAAGGNAVRITFEGSYNADADISPDGRQMVMVHGGGGKFRIALMDLQSGALRVLTDGSLDESPSFAPNASMIIYATESGARGVLAAVSQDGRFKQVLTSQSGDIREPAWSPFTGN